MSSSDFSAQKAYEDIIKSNALYQKLEIQSAEQTGELYYQLRDGLSVR